MEKINILCFILLFFLPYLLKAQTIQGTITDPLTGKGISGLVVAIGDSSAISDSLGNYIIHLGLPISENTPSILFQLRKPRPTGVVMNKRLSQKNHIFAI